MKQLSAALSCRYLIRSTGVDVVVGFAECYQFVVVQRPLNHWIDLCVVGLFAVDVACSNGLDVVGFVTTVAAVATAVLLYHPHSLWCKCAGQHVVVAVVMTDLCRRRFVVVVVVV